MNNNVAYIIIALLFGSCVHNKSEQLSIAKFFYDIPTDTCPKLFMPDYFAEDLNVRDITFLPDYTEFYYTQILSDTVIKVSKYGNRGWATPTVVKFSGKYSDFEPFITNDGQELFFSSKRPTNSKNINKNDIDIWKVNRVGSEWSIPMLIEKKINTNCMEYYPSVAKNGNLYFGRNDSALTRGDIYVSKLHNNLYLTPDKLSEVINGPSTAFNAFISPSEDYIIFSTYVQDNENWHSDLFISYKSNDGKWQMPINLGKIINSKGNELSPWISYDSKFLFFSSTRHDSSGLNMNFKIFWIKTSAIEGFEFHINKPEYKISN